jgi:hypothetical protein
MNESTAPIDWYIVKRPAGYCDVVSDADLDSSSAPNSEPAANAETQQWGPFSSQSEAIARRVGLIRAGKCLPR